MATLTKEVRVEMRASHAQREILDRATATCGLSMTDFVLNAALDRAGEVLEKHQVITLKNEEFDNFISVCNEAREPNQALKDALKFTRESGIE
jgi:uncharacterized protein (DUF1778 family)